MIRLFIRRFGYIILYGTGLALLLFLLKWLEWRFLIFNHTIELYTAGIAILFTGLGIWLALKIARPRPASSPGATTRNNPEATITIPATGTTLGNAVPDTKTIAKLGLSTRELEVLQLMAEGLSNQEIADRLYLSLNTIKTHSSRIFEKLDARRRTQAIETARRLRVIA